MSGKSETSSLKSRLQLIAILICISSWPVACAPKTEQLPDHAQVYVLPKSREWIPRGGAGERNAFSDLEDQVLIKTWRESAIPATMSMIRNEGEVYFGYKIQSSLTYEAGQVLSNDAYVEFPWSLYFEGVEYPHYQWLYRRDRRWNQDGSWNW